MSDPNRSEHARVIARSVLANLESLQAEGLGAGDLGDVTAICRTLDASAVDPDSAGILVRRLRALLTAAHGLTGRTFVGWLDDIDSST
ncbi:hypothetical protein GCM10023201_52740 [Actinomycetospora corticicola]|uniref:Uncharacterized protein n=1 Tax=Actinomycetospora corticicola TaxID=663602 RepID=A0A7Y9J6L9_9PSEU|nr:hypothetical protein [Actinomycetospora corticicola]NYD37462.1 hypothetical protein [Actinomycetospora corticicola]